MSIILERRIRMLVLEQTISIISLEGYEIKPLVVPVGSKGPYADIMCFIICQIS